MNNHLYSCKVVASTCPYCGVGCGVDLTVENNEVVSVKGSKKHPANFGKLCVKGTNLAQTAGNKERVLYPQINNKRVDWEEAISTTASKIQDAIDKYGSDSVAFYVSGQILTEDYYVANKLIKGFLGSANIDTNSRLCMSSAVAAYKRAFGSDTVPCTYDDLDQAELTILIGSNAAWTHPILYQRMQERKKNSPNSRYVVIDPQHSASVDIADLHLPILPGTDVALFNGLLNYLIKNNYCQQKFIDESTEGFGATAAKVSSYTISEVSKQCGVSVSAIEAFYAMYTATDKVISFYSQGVNQSVQGVDKCNAIINCHLASAKIGKPGMGPFSITGQPNAMGGREVGGLANMLAAHMDIDNPNHQAIVKEFWQASKMCSKPGYKAVELFERMAAGEIKVLWVMATNPMVSMPNRQEVAKALRQCDTVIVSECYTNTDTLAYADIVLPASTWSEKNGTVTNSERRISRQRGVVAPPGDARHDWQIISQVAQALGYKEQFNYQHAHDIFIEHAKLSNYKNKVTEGSLRDFNIGGLANISLSQYDNLKPITWPVTNEAPYGTSQMFGDALFFTPNRKARFIAVEQKSAVEPADQDFPLILNSGRYRDQWHTMTRTAKSAALSLNQSEPRLDIHPQDIRKYGLVDGDYVKIESRYGEISLRCRAKKEIRPGSCFVPIHWNKQTSAKANVSNCFSSRTDPLSGQPDSKYVAVRLSPIAVQSHWQIVSNKKLILPFTYWTAISLQNGQAYIAADSENPKDVLALCKKLVGQAGELGEWIEYTSSKNKETVIICIENQQLVFFACLSTSRPELDWSWLDSTLKGDISPELGRLLRQDVPIEYRQGKMICSCFQVSESSINEAVKDGVSSVEGLGKKLKCGTNCGSCKAELAQIINTHHRADEVLIHVVNAES